MASNGRRDPNQDDAVLPPSTQRASAQPRPRKKKKQPHTGKSCIAVDSPPSDKPPDLEALRKARLDYINIPAEERPKKMRYVGETITREPANKADLQHVRKVSGTRRRRKRIDPERKHHHRKNRIDEVEDGEYQSVYGRHDRQQDIESKKVDVDEHETDGVSNSDAHSNSNEASDPTQNSNAGCSKISTPGPDRRQDGVVERRRQTSRRRQSEPVKRIHHSRRNSYGIDECPLPSMQR
jgi:hypothetical protein